NRLRCSAVNGRTERTRMPSLKQLEERIFQKEGFRVRFTPLNEKTKTYPEYGYEVMASNRWKVSDWRMERLEAYVPLMRSVEVLRGDGKLAKTDMRLGNLRDTYFEAVYGNPKSPSAE